MLAHVVAGRTNQRIAAGLGTAEDNVKVHRAEVMRKIGVRSVAEPVRAAWRVSVWPVP